MASSPTPGVILPTQTVVNLSSSAGFDGLGGGTLGAPPDVSTIRIYCRVKAIKPCRSRNFRVFTYPLEESS